MKMLLFLLFLNGSHFVSFQFNFQSPNFCTYRKIRFKTDICQTEKRNGLPPQLAFYRSPSLVSSHHPTMIVQNNYQEIDEILW
ncbi:hypothetical protein BLOT_008780 [Blomia tropicalis]|nr:hypothetical protein BLOT_008780 [Blomia tropicalis]